MREGLPFLVSPRGVWPADPTRAPLDEPRAASGLTRGRMVQGARATTRRRTSQLTSCTRTAARCTSIGSWEARRRATS